MRSLGRSELPLLSMVSLGSPLAETELWLKHDDTGELIHLRSTHVRPLCSDEIKGELAVSSFSRRCATWDERSNAWTVAEESEPWTCLTGDSVRCEWHFNTSSTLHEPHIYYQGRVDCQVLPTLLSNIDHRLMLTSSDQTTWSSSESGRDGPSYTVEAFLSAQGYSISSRQEEKG